MNTQVQAIPALDVPSGSNLTGSTGIERRRIGGSLGVELHGIDIAALDQDQLEAIHQALLDHHLVVLKDQDTKAGNVDAFGKMFGPRIKETIPLKLALGHKQYPDIIVLENKGYAKSYINEWHSEATAFRLPPSVSMLAGRTIPEAGGDTLFANQHAAFEALSPAMQEMLMPLKADHAVGFDEKSRGEAVHPVVRVHPVTGRKALYVNATFTKKFHGMTAEESRGLMDYLFKHSTRPEFCYRHRHQVGDLLIWDNRSVQHRAIQDYGDAERRMYHVEIMHEETS